MVALELIDSASGLRIDALLRSLGKRRDQGSLMLPSQVARCQLLVVSEEQLKLFQLPHFKPQGKLKLTAQDGALVRRAQVARVPIAISSVATSNQELQSATSSGSVNNKATVTSVEEHCCLFALTNQGDVRAFTLGTSSGHLAQIGAQQADGASSSSSSSSGGGSLLAIGTWQLISREDLV